MDSTKEEKPKYDISHLNLMRNGYNTVEKKKAQQKFFMLDYFDLMFHQRLEGKDKNYKNFLDISDDNDERSLDYKTADRTLSIYKEHQANSSNIFDNHSNKNHTELSNTPFLGIIQINFMHHNYDKELSVKETLPFCEEKIITYLKTNHYMQTNELRYEIYRSCTSGDFCLIVRSATIQAIYKIASMINNLTLKFERQELNLCTYTNIGIDCMENKSGGFLALKEETLQQNEDCTIALRFTTNSEFAKKLWEKIHDIEHTGGKLEGLFGRYDFLLHISLREFSMIFPKLCKAKLLEKGESAEKEDVKEEHTFLERFVIGINNREVTIINERVLVPLDDEGFEIFVPEEDYGRNNGINIENKIIEVDKKRREFEEYLKNFGDMGSVFLEEGRAFTDIKRELWEVVNTYGSQGIENDSYTNWQIFVYDVETLFHCIDAWQAEYNEKRKATEPKEMRSALLNDLRLCIQAINEYYKFLQSVNLQTWQSPTYEIQTKLDAEKMMIAYRQFLYEYFDMHKKGEGITGDKSDSKRYMFCPIVYPDMSIDRASVLVPFLNQKIDETRLLICNVPSFEYYGRIFDMIPWILHEASHSVRTMKREHRNNYLIEHVFRSIFSEVIYKLLNRYSDDFGYYTLGVLEEHIIEALSNAANEEFKTWCKEENVKINSQGVNYLEKRLLIFLRIIFDRSVFNEKREKSRNNNTKIQEALLRVLGNLNILEGKIHVGNNDISIAEAVQGSMSDGRIMFKLLELIYNEYYKRMTGNVPDSDEWKLLKESEEQFEQKLMSAVSKLDDEKYQDWKRDYCFSMRSLNRLYLTWEKAEIYDLEKTHRENIIRRCVNEIHSVLDEGYESNKGFAELYRIFNMVFGNGNRNEEEEIKRISKIINVMLKEDAEIMLVREIKLYRETCADLYMVATLGLSAFGYCRQMFQTYSDASVEESIERRNAIDVQRFRAVAGFLLINGGEGKIKDCIKEKEVSIASLAQKGKTYCISSMYCVKERVKKDLLRKKEEGKIEDKNIYIQKIEDISWFTEVVVNDLEEIFETFTRHETIEYALNNSSLIMVIDEKNEVDKSNQKLIKDWEKRQKEYSKVKEDLAFYRHVFYRVKCFIQILDMISDHGVIRMKKSEYDHLKELYDVHSADMAEIRASATCAIVADYYNNPESPVQKNHKQMLEDTIDFIEEYYYRNRFQVMTSTKEESRTT